MTEYARHKTFNLCTCITLPSLLESLLHPRLGHYASVLRGSILSRHIVPPSTSMQHTIKLACSKVPARSTSSQTHRPPLTGPHWLMQWGFQAHLLLLRVSSNLTQHENKTVHQRLKWLEKIGIITLVNRLREMHTNYVYFIFSTLPQ